MNTTNLRIHSIALALGAFTFLGGVVAPVRAQDAGTTAATETTKPISLNLVNVPVQAALRTLFSSAGVRNYSIKSDVQGFANINVSEVPFNLALRQILSSVNPPLTYTVIDGTYMVSVQPTTPPPVVTVPAPTLEGETSFMTDTTSQPKRFYTVPINHYDAYVIAQLLEQTTGIIPVPVNVVIPSSGSSGIGNNGGNSGFGGNLSAPVTTIGNGNNNRFGSNRFGGTGRNPSSIGQSF